MNDKGGLRRSLSLGQFFSISFGAAVGVGWIVLMGDWLAVAGPLGAALAFLISGLAVGWVALGYLELATAIPRPGGEMIYAFEVFGARTGFIVGWFLAATNISISAFEAISIGWIVSVIVPIPDGPVLYTVFGEEVYAVRMVVGLVFLLVMGWLNYRGAVFAAFAQALFLVFFFVAVTAFLGAGLLGGEPENLRPLFSGETVAHASSGVLSMLAIAPMFILGFNFALQGISERAPGVDLRDVARVIILSIVAVAVFYALIIVATAVSAPRDLILAADLPAAAAFRFALGDGILGQMVLLAGLFGLLTTWNALLFAATRILFELGEKGLLPEMFRRVHPKHGSPHVAAVFVTLASVPGVLLSKAALSAIISAASICAILGLFVTCLAAAVRRARDGTDAPFRVPGGRIGLMLVVAIGAVLLFVAVFEPLITSGTLYFPLHWGIVGAWGLAGWGLWHAGRRRARQRPPRDIRYE